MSIEKPVLIERFLTELKYKTIVSNIVATFLFIIYL